MRILWTVENSEGVIVYKGYSESEARMVYEDLGDGAVINAVHKRGE